MSRKLFTIALCFLMSIGAALAQNTVSGIVKDAETGEPVVSAAVQLKGNTGVYAMTDDAGSFIIEVPANSVLVVSSLGYHSAEVNVGGNSNLVISLEADSICLMT